ncbi:uncharacterized protein [Misgurnus anguillicaudatus]|uniref:uncharacterized protein isoform X2 n=1 Tax=Misgurnus anguillicaudatus TaxID=75329 RepID=UPI003CCF1D6A
MQTRDNDITAVSTNFPRSRLHALIIGGKSLHVTAVAMMLGIPRQKKRKRPQQDAEHHITCKTDKPELYEQVISKYKGRGVFTTEAFFRGDFVLEYRGELLTSEESLDRSELYNDVENTFLFDFQWHGKNWCMDASKEDGSLGRLVNDEHRNPTCKIRTVEVNKKPHLCLFAVRDIQPGEEITYSYGDSDWPWRAKVSSTESSDKSPVSSLDLQKLFHQAPPVSSSALYKVYINEPHKQVEPQQSGKASTSENKMKLKDCHERFNRAQIKTITSAIEPSQEYFMPSSPVMTTSSFSALVQPSSPVKTTSSSSSPVQPSSPVKTTSSSSALVQPSSPVKTTSSSSALVQPSSPVKTTSSSSSPVQPSSPVKTTSSSSALVQPSSSVMTTSSSSTPVQPSSPVMTTSSSSALVQPSSPVKTTSSSSALVQPSSSVMTTSSSSTPVQPSSPVMTTSSSSALVQPSSPVKTTSSSSALVQPSSSVMTTSSSSSPVHPSTPLPCAASTPVISSSQVSETLSLMEYSGSAYSDSDVTDYSDVDYIPQISSDESDGSASGQSKAERSSDGSNNKSECSDPRPNKRLRHTKSTLSKRKAEEAGSSSAKCMTAVSSKRMKCQTEETETSSDKKTLVQSMPSPQKKSRSYNKKQYCLYCSKPYAKMARHLEFVHRNEVEVAKAVAFPKRSKERRVQLNLLRKKGNFAHNTDVVRKGEGEMIACYRPKKCKNPKEFIHCIHCQGLYNKLSLWKHIKNCPLKPKDDDAQGRKRVRSLCALKTPVGLEVSKGFKKVLSLMNYDEVSRVIHSDRCIMQLGEHMFNRMGSDVTKHDYIRQKMREVGRLLLEARRITPLKTMEDFMIPANFKHVISAVKVVSGFDEEKNSYRIPSLALKLGHSLKKICSIVESNAMMYGDHERAECARDFRKVHQARWNEYISAGAITTLKEAKWNAPQIIPFTQDVKVLHAHLEKKRDKFLNKLKNCPSADSYAALAKVTLSQVILFNRRREGEVSRMLLSAFQSRDSSELHEDIAICLSEFERKLCKHFTRVEIRGKRGRKVPVLLKPSLVSAMKLLVETREACGVPNENPFMFARSGAMSAYRGGECISKAARECGIKNPEALSSTRLRKHIATMSKILNLDENEADQLADFLGHDIRIHRQYYRLPEGTLQLAKMSKVLMAMEKGTLSSFKGKRLDDIEIDPNEQLEAEGDSMSSDEEDCSDLPQTTSPVPAETDQPSASQKDQGSSIPPKRNWEEVEVKAVEKHLMKFIKTCKVPGKQDCERCIQAEPEALKERTWTGVKNYVRNRITTLKKQGGL